MNPMCICACLQVSPYYDFVNVIDSDEELELGSGSDDASACSNN
jgi:hypothetical protein